MKQYCLRDQEGHVFKGTAVDVVEQMQRTAIFYRDLTLPEYVQRVAQNLWKFFGMGVDVGNGTVEEQCERLLEAVKGKLLFE